MPKGFPLNRSWGVNNSWGPYSHTTLWRTSSTVFLYILVNPFVSWKDKISSCCVLPPHTSFDIQLSLILICSNSKSQTFISIFSRFPHESLWMKDISWHCLGFKINTDAILVYKDSFVFQSQQSNLCRRGCLWDRNSSASNIFYVAPSLLSDFTCLLLRCIATKYLFYCGFSILFKNRIVIAVNHIKFLSYSRDGWMRMMDSYFMFENLHSHLNNAFLDDISYIAAWPALLIQSISNVLIPCNILSREQGRKISKGRGIDGYWWMRDEIVRP